MVATQIVQKLEIAFKFRSQVLDHSKILGSRSYGPVHGSKLRPKHSLNWRPNIRSPVETEEYWSQLETNQLRSLIETKVLVSNGDQT